MPILETGFRPRKANQTEKRDGKQGCKPCLAYEDVNHSCTRCYLVLGQDKEWIPKDNWETFRGNIEVPSFRNKVDNFKVSEKSFEDWRCEDGSSSQDKIMNKVSTFSDWDMHSHNSDNDYLLLNSTAFVHIFHNKNRFTNFRRATKNQRLLCGIETIIIGG